MYTVIDVEILHAVATITINRPDKLNALNAQVFSELDLAIKSIEYNPEVRCVIITGAGPKAFVAGADISELHSCDSVTGLEFSESGQRVFSAIENLRIPVIAAVNGFALGGGCELAMACHMRFASNKAKFGQPEINLGIIPGYGGTQRLARLVGRPKAMELIVSGDLIDSEQALKLGLVNRVYEPEELMAKTSEFAHQLALKAPIAMRGCVQTVTMAWEPLNDGLAAEARLFGEICGTDDFKEGTSAFLEKRQPTFAGK
ncbi:MAG: enoyl-CoA hydratase/isomerase family protein [Ignavibacteria bacterium]|nr:enoyl-CoA hydratase/isomerase family protein [Ignavibacteria bacterium]